MTRITSIVWIGVLLTITTGATREMKHVVSLTTSDVTTHAPEDTSAVTYYVFQLPVPESVTAASIREAYLEFYAGVSATTIDGWKNETPVVEMYMLESTFSEVLNPAQVRKPSGMVRNVRIGQNRRVRINVTEAIHYYASNPTKNYGLVLGSFRGEAEGRFAIRTNQLEGNAVARLTILTADQGAD